MVEVINPRTGEIENISRADPTFYSAGGFKARKYGQFKQAKGNSTFRMAKYVGESQKRGQPERTSQDSCQRGRKKTQGQNQRQN